MPSSHNLRLRKRALRERMETIRAEAAARQAGASQSLHDVFLRNVPLPATGLIAFYYPHGSEIDPMPLAGALRARGLALALPVVAARNAPLIFRAYAPGDALRPGLMRVQEPLDDALSVEPDMVLVPLLAFDRRGFRLGYGGGYYDRTLFALRRQKPVVAIGLAFACQEVAEVPTGFHDVRLDAIVTEQAVHRP